MLIGMNIEGRLREKICRGEYVDFAKLLPKDKLINDDQKLELIHKDGQTYFCQLIEELVLQFLVFINGNKLSESMQTSILMNTQIVHLS